MTKKIKFIALASGIVFLVSSTCLIQKNFESVCREVINTIIFILSFVAFEISISMAIGELSDIKRKKILKWLIISVFILIATFILLCVIDIPVVFKAYVIALSELVAGSIIACY